MSASLNRRTWEATQRSGITLIELLVVIRSIGPIPDFVVLWGLISLSGWVAYSTGRVQQLCFWNYELA